MLVARAFVLSFNARGAFAVLIVAMSVAYALLTGSAAGGLEAASDSLDPDLARPVRVYAYEDMRPFFADEVPDDSTLYAHAAWEGGVLGTIRPWPYDDAVVVGQYARVPEEALEALGLPVRPIARNLTAAPGDWALVPPEVFDREAPGVAGLATFAVSAREIESAVPSVAAPAANAFYEEGARQVFASVHLVILATGVTVAVLSAGVLRLEVLARERDLATIEALAGSRVAVRIVLLRAAFLSVVGVALGTAMGLALARLAGRAIGGLAFGVHPGLVVETALVALVAGCVAGGLGGAARLRAPLASRLGRRGIATRPFPGPVRFLFVTPRLTTSAFVAALIMTGISGVVLAAASVPYAIFEPGGDVEIVGQAPGNPFRGSASRFFGEHVTVLENVSASSPEVNAPTLVRGHGVMAHGVLFDRWREIDDVALVRGGWPDAPGEATVGARLARLLDVEPGETLLLPGAYRATAHSVRVVGVHEGAGLLDDELVVDLDTAADLAGLPPDTVHLVRLRAEPGAIDRQLAQSTIVVTDLEVVPGSPVPNTEASARLSLVNLGATQASRTLHLRVNDVLVASAVARMPAYSRDTVELPFVVPDEPRLVLEVNPRLEVETASPQLQVLGPERVAVGEDFVVTVLDESGAAVPGAEVEADGNVTSTDGSGRATVRGASEGPLLVTATLGNATGGRVVYVVDPATALQPRLHLVASAILATAPENATHLRYTIGATLQNVGGAAFHGTLNVTSGAAVVGNATLDLAPEDRTTLEIDAVVPRATRALRVADASVALPDEADPTRPPEQRPRTIEDVLREKRAAVDAARASRDLRAEAFIDDVFGNLEPAVVVVVLATFVHAAAGLVVAVLREMREREEVRRTLEELGATQDQVSLRAARDALLSATPGLVAGALVAWALLALLQPLSFPAAFGHTIPLVIDVPFVARVVGGLALVAVLVAFWASQGERSQPPRQAPPRDLADVLEGRA